MLFFYIRSCLFAIYEQFAAIYMKKFKHKFFVDDKNKISSKSRSQKRWGRKMLREKLKTLKFAQEK
jgi:hypothetical protein